MSRGKTTGRYTPRRRGGRGGDDGGDVAWLTTYGDMATVLMAFFVLLYAMSSVDAIKFEALVAGLAVPFGNEAGQGLLPAQDGLVDGIEAPVPVATDQVVAADLDTPEDLEPETTTASDLEADLGAELDSDLEEVERALNEALTEAGLDGLVTTRREERGLVVSVASDDVLFALGSTRISELGHRVITTVTRTLRSFGNDVLVEGHTDDLPLERGRYTNWNLSTDRAVAVLSAMIGEHRFPPERAGAVGFGEHRPLVENTDDAARARNRRVDVVVLHEEHTP